MSIAFHFLVHPKAPEWQTIGDDPMGERRKAMGQVFTNLQTSACIRFWRMPAAPHTTRLSRHKKPKKNGGGENLSGSLNQPEAAGKLQKI